MNKKERDAFDYFYQEFLRCREVTRPLRKNWDKYDEFYHGYRAENRMPLSYNVTFRKDLPMIMTTMSRYMGQLYQGDEIVAVRPNTSQAADRAEVIEGLLNWQLQNLNGCDQAAGSFNIHSTAFLSSLIYGFGIKHTYWKREERATPRRMRIPVPNIQMIQGVPQIVDIVYKDELILEDRITYDGPYCEVVPIRQFIFDPEYKDIGKMPAVGYVHKVSMDFLKKYSRENGGPFKNVNKIGQSKSKWRIEEDRHQFRSVNRAYSLEEIENDKHKANNIDLIKLYGKYDINNDGVEEEVICVIANHEVVIQFEENFYGERPFHKVPCYENLGSFCDMGFMELIMGMVQMYDDVSNLYMHESLMRICTMLKVLIDSDLTPEQLILKPFGILPVEQMGEIEPMSIPDYQGQRFQQTVQFLESTMHDAIGMYGPSLGQPQRRQEYPGTIQSLQSMGESRVKFLLQCVDHQALRPWLRYIMLLNTYHLADGFEFRVNKKTGYEFRQAFGEDLIVGGYDFSARFVGMDASLSKGVKLDKLVNMSQMFQQNPYIRDYAFTKAIVELADLYPAEKYIYTPEEVQQMEQQNMQLQMQIDAANKEFELQKVRESQKGNEVVAHERNAVDLQKAKLKSDTDLQKERIKAVSTRTNTNEEMDVKRMKALMDFVKD